MVTLNVLKQCSSYRAALISVINEWNITGTKKNPKASQTITLPPPCLSLAVGFSLSYTWSVCLAWGGGTFGDDSLLSLINERRSYFGTFLLQKREHSRENLSCFLFWSAAGFHLFIPESPPSSPRNLKVPQCWNLSSCQMKCDHTEMFLRELNSTFLFVCSEGGGPQEEEPWNRLGEGNHQVEAELRSQSSADGNDSDFTFPPLEFGLGEENLESPSMLDTVKGWRSWLCKLVVSSTKLTFDLVKVGI